MSARGAFAAKLSAVVVGAAIVAGLFVYWVADFLRDAPPTVTAVSEPSTPGHYTITMQTVASVGFGEHPTWVSYLIQDPPTGRWVHTTLFRVPANSTIDVKLFEYDGATTVRNNYWSLVQGTDGGVEYVNGKPTSVVDGQSSVAHSFAIPELGVFVPLQAPSQTNNLCSVAPCSLSSPHTVINFSFHTGAPGVYRWQCFVPCGLSFLNGNGGPMQTLGYMDGFVKVVA